MNMNRKTLEHLIIRQRGTETQQKAFLLLSTKTKILFLGLPFLLLAFVNSTVQASPASYLDIDPAARPAGMGSAFTGLADDGNAALFNPAGLATMGLNDFLATGSVDLLSLDRLHNFASVSQQLPPNSYLGFHIDQYGVNNIFGSDTNGSSTSNLNDTELDCGASYAIDLGYHFKAGINAGFLYQNLTGTHAYGFDGVDLGVLVVPSTLYDLTLGACIHHLGGFLAWDTGTTQYLNPDLRAGLSYKLFDQTVVVAYDAESTLQGSFKIIHHGGAEVWFIKYFAVRGGIDNSNPTMGASFRYLNYGLDYAYEFESNNLGDSQMLSFDLIF